MLRTTAILAIGTIIMGASCGRPCRCHTSVDPNRLVGVTLEWDSSEPGERSTEHIRLQVLYAAGRQRDESARFTAFRLNDKSRDEHARYIAEKSAFALSVGTRLEAKPSGNKTLFQLPSAPTVYLYEGDNEGRLVTMEGIKLSCGLSVKLKLTNTP